jgi:hypothetical protein
VTTRIAGGIWFEAAGTTPTSTAASRSALKAVCAAFGIRAGFAEAEAGTLSAGTTTQDEIIWPLSSVPTLTTSRRQATLSPSSPSFHPFDFDDDIAGGVSLDGELGVDGTGKRGVTARPAGVDAAMVDDDDGAIKGLPDGIGRPQVGGHVLIVGFGADEGPVEGVERHRDRLAISAEREANRIYEFAVLCAEVHGRRDEVKGDRIGVRGQVAQPEGLGALAVAGLALEGAVHRRAAMHRAAAVLSATIS